MPPGIVLRVLGTFGVADELRFLCALAGVIRPSPVSRLQQSTTNSVGQMPKRRRSQVSAKPQQMNV